MRRPPHMGLAMWFRQNARMNRSWVVDSACGRHPELPWIEDARPSPRQLLSMQNICARCPVIVRCAKDAVEDRNGRGVDGGFYAGVWIPWTYPGMSRAGHAERRNGRSTLKDIAALETA